VRVDLARWQSGHAAACKAVDAGSIPTLASIFRERTCAPVAESVDATDLKSVIRKGVPVRVRPGAPQRLRRSCVSSPRLGRSFFVK
jgi:hypothetical protein